MVSLLVLVSARVDDPCAVQDNSPVIPLLATDSSGASLQVCPSGMAFLTNELGALDLYTTVVAGPARTGKSFLINNLLGLEQNTGFSG